MKKLLFAAMGSMAILAGSPGLKAQSAISASDLLIFQAGTSAVAASASATPIVIDEINPTLTNQTTPVQSFNISSMSSPLYTSNEGSDGDLALSDNGTLLSFAGWTTTNGSAAENLVGGRGAGTLSLSGSYSLAATYTGSTTAGNQTRAAYSPDGANWYFGDKGGVYSQNGTTPLVSSSNTRSIKGFGGSTYGLDADAGLKVVGTITPSTPDGSSYAYGGLTGLPTDTNAVDFALVSSSNNGVYDTLYYADSTADSILKYALLNGTWTSEGSDALPSSFKLSQMTAAEAPGGGVDIYFTSNPSASNAVLDEIVDSSALASTMAVTGTTTLYTAPTGDDLRGVSLAPAAVPEPRTWGTALMGLASLLIYFSKRGRTKRAGNG